MSVLHVENLYKTYGEKVLFNDISFSIKENERIGLLGVNGTGKSTLLKVIAGIESAERGEMLHANSLQIEYLPQQPELDPELTVLEQIYYGDSVMMKVMREYEKALQKLEHNPEKQSAQELVMSMQQKMDEADAWDANTAAKTVLTKLGISDFDKKVKFLSGGQKKRVAIAKALIQPADLLILDEPTNHLDNMSIEWLEGYLAAYKGSLIVVTHDRYFLNRVTNQIFELENGSLYTYEGNYETYLEKKAEREAATQKSEEKRQNLLRRELAWLQRGAKARTTKQKARKQRVEGLKEQKGPEAIKDVDFSIGSIRLGKQVIEAQDITFSYAADQKPLVKDFSYLVVPGERLGIIGPNGAGKSTLLNILADRTQPQAGKVDFGQTVKIGYYIQEYEEMDENLRLIEYIREVAEVVHTVDGQVITAEQMLERFLFSREMQWTYIRRLSGGERRRLYLLSVLMEEPNVLFLDEPTNDLDTQTLSILEDYLDQFPGVVITVSHDRYFLDRVVDRLLVCKGGSGEIERFQGSYSAYINNQKKEASLQKETKAGAGHAPKQARQSRKKLSYKEQQEWNQIEDKIMELEMKKEELEAEIGEAGSDFDKIQESMKKQAEVEAELEKTIERWTELSLMIEEIESGKQQ
ncbi:ABC-F family ATP-binding cassette domain-containing protein [Thalassorhabdus alkalitolerans]|uniref:ABC-F family ATP-binding cassette domain-containing protein n=1 Tax=Thalassorhabdus alkalitolerans TaxID=2282697 RepID=A0ABW0YLW4_9BACI